MENETHLMRANSWREAVTLLFVAIFALVALNVSGVKRHGKGSSTSIYMGDMYVKFVLSSEKFKLSKAQYAPLALKSYREGLPSPAAYRRIGIMQQVVLGKPGLKDLLEIDSPQAVKGLSKAQVKKLQNEVRMWRTIYGHESITGKQADDFAGRIRELNLGPLKNAAVADTYARAGNVKKANYFLKEASDQALQSIIGIFAIMAVFFVAGMLGVVFIIYFLVTYGAAIARRTASFVSPAVLIYTFLAYLVSYIIYGVVFGWVSSGPKGGAVELLLQSFAIVAAFVTGLAVFRKLVPYASLEIVGVRKIPGSEIIKWGIGGYCAAVPLVIIASYINKWVLNVVFKGAEAPEHPIIPFVTEGGAPLVVAFIIAVILAPVVEETFFRGMLYTGFRDRLGVWPAVFISGGVFAAIHPTLISQFLPLMMLGVVLALLREKTNSLIPSMICHAVNNILMLLLSRVMF